MQEIIITIKFLFLPSVNIDGLVNRPPVAEAEIITGNVFRSFLEIYSIKQLLSGPVQS